MTTKNWHFWLTLLVCVSLSLTLVQSATANPPDATHHGITETELDEFRLVEVGVGDTLYAANWDGQKVKRSTDHGANWSPWRNFPGYVRGLFVDSGGNVYLTFAGNDTLKRCNAAGTCADVLTFPVTAYSWYMAQNDSLYCATYATEEGTTDTTGAYVYRSTAGNVWTLLNHPHSRHYHFVAAHPWNDTLYTSRGDGPGNQFLEKSGDNGTNFTTVLSADCLAQPVSFAFTPTRIVMGSDCGDGDANRLYFQDNTDGSWTTAETLSGTQDNFVWSMATDDDRVVFCGTAGRAAEDNDVRMYASYDSGDTWLSVKDFHDEVEWGGVKWISQGTDDSGYKYYCVNDEDGSGFQTFRFLNVPVWTVGTGGDFADIATALADFRVGAADTLIMLANGGAAHAVQDDALPAGMTVRGATRDASLYLIKNGAQNASGFTCAAAGVELKDLTFRSIGGEFTTNLKAMVEVTDGGQIAVTRCAFRNCDGNNVPCIYAEGTGAGTTTVTTTDCIVDSCSSDVWGGGFVYVNEAQTLTIDGLIASNCWSAGDGGVMNATNHHGHIQIENSLFVDNRCLDEGAAFKIETENTGSTKVWHCTFNGNETADVDEGQIKIMQIAPVNVISHCIFANSDSTYALSTSGYPDSVRHCNSYNTGEDNFGWNSPACTDTIHIDPIYNDTCNEAPCYKAKAKGCRDSADGSFMGWLHYIPDSGASGGHRRTVRRRR